MAKDLKTLALARLSGFRHKTVKVPEWLAHLPVPLPPDT